MTHNPRFKGYIHDVGGPTANFRYPSCKKQLKYGLCQNRKCLAPKPCPHMDIDHSEYIDLLRKLRKIKGVKKVFVRSGIRYDYAIADPDPTFMQELVKYHISGPAQGCTRALCQPRSGQDGQTARSGLRPLLQAFL